MPAAPPVGGCDVESDGESVGGNGGIDADSDGKADPGDTICLHAHAG